MRRGVALAAVGLIGASAITACAAIIGLDPGTPLPDDVVTTDIVAVDVAADAPTSDAPVVDYGSISDVSRWSSFDLATLAPSASGYGAGVYDANNKRMYFVPYAGGNPGRLAVLDLTQPFTSPSAWTLTDVSGSTGLPYARGYIGAELVSGTLICVPYYVYFSAVSYGYQGFLGFWDVGTPPDAGWSNTNMNALHANAVGFLGSAFDGRYVYLAPQVHSIAARYDTTGAKDAGASYDFFDTSTLVPPAPSFRGAVYDGRYVYYIPIGGSVAARYDTTGQFLNASSWTTFDLKGISANATSYGGGIFDGRYVYYAPYGGTTPHGFALRYDTTLPFAQASSWSIFDLASKVSPSAIGLGHGAFDGRFVYFQRLQASIVVSYDTTQPFDVPSSWRALNLATLDAGPVGSGFAGAAFDGEYVYFFPSGSVVFRYDARTPPGFPSTVSGGSFF